MRHSSIVATLPFCTFLAACRTSPPSPVAVGAGPPDPSLSGGTQADAQAASLTTLSLSDSGASVTMQPGGTLLIKLPSNAGTGYVWELTRVDRAVVDLAGPPTIEHDGGQEGALTNRVFSFVAKGSGVTRVEIAHHRPWESAPAHRTFVVDITVQ